MKDIDLGAAIPVKPNIQMIFALLTTDPQKEAAYFFNNFAELKQKTAGDWCAEEAHVFFFDVSSSGLVLVIDANQFPKLPAHLFDGLWQYLSQKPGIILHCQTDDVQYIEEVFKWVCDHEPNVQVNLEKSIAQRMPAIDFDEILNWCGKAKTTQEANAMQEMLKGISEQTKGKEDT